MSFVAAYVFSPQIHSTDGGEHRLSAACSQNKFAPASQLFLDSTHEHKSWSIGGCEALRFFHTCKPWKKAEEFIWKTPEHDFHPKWPRYRRSGKSIVGVQGARHPSGTMPFMALDFSKSFLMYGINFRGYPCPDHAGF
jgi:hypothetical protein